MPAIDSMVSGGAIHISDQNKRNPIKTLCGQALDKETVRYFSAPENFDRADCKVCRSIYFDESWSGETRSENQSEQESTPSGSSNRLFATLQTPVNSHDRP